MRNKRIITFWYKNYRGKKRMRRARPLSIRWGVNVLHLNPQWLMLAIDVETGKTREFAMRGMSRLLCGADAQFELQSLMVTP